MKIIYNNIIPIKGFSAINLFGVIFARIEAKPLTEQTIAHEKIHAAQMKELLFVFFYLLYALEWVVLYVRYKDANRAYFNVSFEKEAYKYQGYSHYLRARKHFAQWR